MVTELCRATYGRTKIEFIFEIGSLGNPGWIETCDPFITSGSKHSLACVKAEKS